MRNLGRNLKADHCHTTLVRAWLKLMTPVLLPNCLRSSRGINHHAPIIACLILLLAVPSLEVTYAQMPLAEEHQSPPAAHLGDHVSLIGTAIVDSTGHRSVAVLEDKKTHTQLTIEAGETLYGSVVKRIRRQYIIYAVLGKEYRLDASEGLLDTLKPQPESSPLNSLYQTATMQTLKISREAIDHARADLHSLLSQSTFYPFYRDGKPEGFMIRGIQKESFLENIGLQENDIIQLVEGHPITAMDDWVLVYDWIQQKEQIEIGLLRGGRAFIFEYQIVKTE